MKKNKIPMREFSLMPGAGLELQRTRKQRPWWPIGLYILLVTGAGAAIANRPKTAPIPDIGPEAHAEIQPIRRSTEAQKPQMPAIGAMTAQAAAGLGVLSCAQRIDRLGQYIGANAETGAYFFAPPAQPDQRLVSFSYEVRPEDARLPAAYASASFAPNQANGCGAIYEAVVYWPQDCGTVANREFAQFRAGRSVQKNLLVLENQTPARVFLMPAGQGCLSIKKEIVL